jgi:hypothetical protein
MTSVRWPSALDDHEASFDAEEGELVAGLAHLDTLAVPDALGVSGAEAVAGDRSIARAVAGWLLVGALALMVVAAFLL